MSNLSALKQILTALGGTPAAGDTNDETIAKIATALSGKEFLPAVTSSNNGQGLVVKSGKWEVDSFPTELPSVSASNVGEVLTVSDQGKWVAASLPNSQDEPVS